MKRLFAYLLALALLLGLAGCEAESRRAQNRAEAVEAALRFYDSLGIHNVFDSALNGDGPTTARGCYIDSRNGDKLTLRLREEPTEEIKELLYEACGTRNIAFDWLEFTEEEIKAAEKAVKEYNNTHTRQFLWGISINKWSNCVRIMVREGMLDEAEKLRKEHPCILYLLYEPKLIPVEDEGLATDGYMTLTIDPPVLSRKDLSFTGTLKNNLDRSANYLWQDFQVKIDGVWYTLPRPEYSETLTLPGIGSGEERKSWGSLDFYDYDFPPGQYRMAVLYTEDFHPLRGRDWDHVAYAEFEIK